MQENTMNFKDIIEMYENEKIEGAYVEKLGNIPVLLTAPHTIRQLKEDYTIFSTINELKESFTENGICRVEMNSPFKGGGITRFVYFSTDIDVIQIEINRNYRDINNSENIKKVCTSLINFIKQ